MHVAVFFVCTKMRAMYFLIILFIDTDLKLVEVFCPMQASPHGLPGLEIKILSREPLELHLLKLPGHGVYRNQYIFGLPAEI